MKSRKTSRSSLLFCAVAAAFFCASSLQAQPLSVTDLGANPPDTLVAALLGIDITVFNVTYTGTGSSSGTFTGGNGIVGFSDGIILSNGGAASVVGPNLVSDCSVSNYLPGDADLANMLGLSVTETFDATVLEFDFIPIYTNLTFQYVFSSEEYNEYVDYNVNDAFGFFVNGVNYALVPGTGSYVSVDTVNNCTNTPYFIDNHPGITSFYGTTCTIDRTSAGLNTQMDGLTTVLTINAPVNAGVTNHIKMVICDVTDEVIDSNVFIRAQSLSSMPTPTPTETPTVTPTPTITPTPTPTPIREDSFYVSENAYRPASGYPVSIYVGYTSYPGPYSLKIYNSAGEQVKVLDPDQVITEPKFQSYSWDGKNESEQDCASGIYVLYLIEPFDRKFKRILLIR